MDASELQNLRETNRRSLEKNREELTRRMATAPLPDPVEKWKREAHRRELDAIHKELNNVRQSHARDLATLSRDIAAVARTIDQLGRTINSKKMDELREDFANGFANLRGAIGDLKH